MNGLFRPEWSTLKKLMFLQSASRGSYATISGNPVTFTAKAAPLRQLEVAFSPVQSGTGDPSPDNVRPISGWDSLNVEQRGRNLNKVPDTVGEITCYDSNGVAITKYGYEIHLPAGTYTLKPTGFKVTDGKTYAYMRLNVVDASGFVSYTSFSAASGASYTQRTITLEDGQWFIYYKGDSTSSGAYVEASNLVIVQGTEDITEAIPFVGQTISISLGQTVYGGTLDVLTGVVTVDKTLRVFDGSVDESWGVNASDGLYAFNIPNLAENKVNRAPLCNMFKGKSPTAYKNLANGECASTASPHNYINFKTDLCSTVEAWRTYLSEHNIQILQFVATPLTIQLTPQEVSSLLGENNMWSDANGNLTVTYAADPATTPIVGKGKVGQAVI